MKFPSWLKVYGDLKYMGDCQHESYEQMSFFSWLRKTHPQHGAIAVHPRNEQLLINGQFRAIAKHKAEGMTTGAADIIVPGAPSFVCELKRSNHIKSKWQAGQLEYLESAHNLGAFVCVALGAEAAIEAFTEYLKQQA